MEKLTKTQVEALLKDGSELEQALIPDFGTKSLTRPIKKNGNTYTSIFKINGSTIHHSVGYSLIKRLKLKSSQRFGLCTKKIYLLKNEK